MLYVCNTIVNIKFPSSGGYKDLSNMLSWNERLQFISFLCFSKNQTAVYRWTAQHQFPSAACRMLKLELPTNIYSQVGLKEISKMSHQTCSLTKLWSIK